MKLLLESQLILTLSQITVSSTPRTEVDQFRWVITDANVLKHSITMSGRRTKAPID